MSKIRNIADIALTTGGTVTVDRGDFSLPVTSLGDNIDIYSEYRITGTESLTSDFEIELSGVGAPPTDIFFRFYWKAVCIPGAFSVTIFGLTVPDDMVGRDFTAEYCYTGGAWSVHLFTVDLSVSGTIPGDRLVSSSVTVLQLGNLAVTTAKLDDLAVTNPKLALLAVEGKNIVDATIPNAKLANMVAYTMKVRDAGTTGVPSDVAVAAQSVLVRQAAGFVNLTPSADGMVIIRKAGVLSADYVNFTELAGSLANAQIPDNEITLAKQQSTGLLYSKYSDTSTTAVTTEEVLATYTLPAATVAADGKGVRVIASGTTAANANTKTIRLKLGGTTYATNAVTTAPNASAWEAEFTILRSGAATAVAVGKAVFTATSEGIQRGTGTPTWANTNAIEVTGQNGTASAGDITVSMVTIELLK